jgi:hypothetical protein
MADHTITLSDSEEEALLYAVDRSSGGTPADILKQWIDRGLGEIVVKLNSQLAAVAELPPDRLARVKRAILDQPEPAREPPPETPLR